MKHQAGFTLIEVLIALAILAIAVTAIIQSTNQNIRDTAYVQHKMTANWVALEIMNEIRLKLRPMSDTSGQTDMLHRSWSWQATLSPTPNPDIKKITLTVHDAATDSKLIQRESYIYAK